MAKRSCTGYKFSNFLATYYDLRRKRGRKLGSNYGKVKDFNEAVKKTCYNYRSDYAKKRLRDNLR